MMDIRENILEIVKKKIECEDIDKSDYDTDLTDIGMDSLTLIGIVVTLEEEYTVEIPDEKLLMSELNTINKIASVIEQTQKNAD